MYCVGRIRTPRPYILGRPLPCIGTASSISAIKLQMANCIEACGSYQVPDSPQPSPTSPPPAMSGKLLLQYLQNILEKEQLQGRIANLASQLGVEADGDSSILLDNIGSLVTETERRKQAAEKRAKTIEDKFLDQAMKIQVLEFELAQARQQRDIAEKNLQDLTWQSTALSSPVPNIRTTQDSWSSEGNPQTPSTAPLENRVDSPTHTPVNIQTPAIPSSPSPQARGPGTPPIATPVTTPLSARSSVVPFQTNSHSRSPSLGAAVGGATSPSGSGAGLPQDQSASFVWKEADLKPFHQGGGDLVLGSGANGTVHLFRHSRTDLPIALKTFELPNDIDGMTLKASAIQSESEILDTLGREDNFPTFLGCLEIGPGLVGLAMEFVGDSVTGEAWTLSRGLQELTLSKHDWLVIALDIAKSLSIIHQKGFLMNDLKEDNCLLRPTPSGQWQAVIVDFGLACKLTSAYPYYFSSEVKEKYRKGEIYVHIAPEVALDDQTTSISSDVFQLGRLFVLMGIATLNGDLTVIGDICQQSSAKCRPSLDEVVDELERVM